MKGSFFLSLALDAAGIAILLVPDDKYRFITPNMKWISYGKRIGFLVLLGAGFLIDRFITHGG